MHQFLNFIFVIKFYMFRTVPLPIIRSISLYTQQWYMSYRFADSLRAGSGRNCSSVLILRFRYLVTLRSKYPQHLISQHSSYILPSTGQTKFPTHIKQQTIPRFVMFSRLYFCETDSKTKYSEPNYRRHCRSLIRP